MTNHYWPNRAKQLALTGLTVCGFTLMLIGGASASANETSEVQSAQPTITTQPMKVDYAATTQTNTSFSQNVKSNQGWYDSTTYSNGQVNVSGWHDVEYYNQATTNSAHHYLLLVNGRTGQTVSSKSADENVNLRPDVARAYPHNVNASSSGFSTSLNVNWQRTGWYDPLYVISRYSSVAPYTSTDGNGGAGSYVDFNSSRFTLAQLLNIHATENQGWFDGSNYSNGNLTVSGWNAIQWSADTNTSGLHHYLIVFDQTRRQQLASVDITNNPVLRFDVQRAYPYIKGAYESGFSYSFKINSSAWLTDQLSLVSRYSIVGTGNGDDGNGNHHVDYWFNINRPSWDNYGWADTASLNGDQIHLSGWHATTASYTEPYHYFILFDKTTNRQVALLKQSANLDRYDVGRYYPTIYNSSHSGFDINIPTGWDKSWLSDQLVLVSRYSMYNTGNGDIGRGGYTDYWSSPFWLK